jgi:hypothetical protein
MTQTKAGPFDLTIRSSAPALSGRSFRSATGKHHHDVLLHCIQPVRGNHKQRDRQRAVCKSDRFDDQAARGAMFWLQRQNVIKPMPAKPRIITATWRAREGRALQSLEIPLRWSCTQWLSDGRRPYRHNYCNRCPWPLLRTHSVALVKPNAPVTMMTPHFGYVFILTVFSRLQCSPQRALHPHRLLWLPGPLILGLSRRKQGADFSIIWNVPGRR